MVENSTQHHQTYENSLRLIIVMERIRRTTFSVGLSLKWIIEGMLVCFCIIERVFYAYSVLYTIQN